MARCVLAAWMMLSISSASAQTGASEYDFRISQETLGAALMDLARQAGVQLLYPYDLALTRGIRPVIGRYTVAESLDLLLRDTGFSGSLTAGGVITIARRNQDCEGTGEAMSPSAMRTTSILALIMGTASASACYAQATGAPGSPEQITEIIVTAQKRSERLQDVPLAIAAVDNSSIEQRGIKDITGLAQLVPGSTIQPVTTRPTAVAIFIRGLGTFTADPLFDPAVLVSLDGVYIPTLQGALFNTFDIDRVEILRGPQGTLQGRNAPGGAVNVTTQRPTGQFGGKVELGWGRFNDLTGQASLQGPIVKDKLAAKISVMGENYPGYVKDTFNGSKYSGRNYFASRLGFLFTPSENFTAYLTGDFVADSSPESAQRNVNTRTSFPRPQTPVQGVPVTCSVFGFCAPQPLYTSQANVSNGTRTTEGGLALNADYDVGPFTISSVTGYRKESDRTNTDNDGLPIDALSIIDARQSHRMLSQELRIASNRGGGADFNGRLDWLVGLYFLNSYFDYYQPQQVLGGPIGIAARDQKTQSYAAFAHLDVHATERLTLSAGVRETLDHKKMTVTRPAPIEASKHWDNLAIDASPQFKIADNKMVYYRFSTGYRAGGFNPTGQVYNEEKVTSHEVGLKTRWLNGRLQINADAFRENYRNMQRTSSIQIPTAPFFLQITTNAARAILQGVEADVDVLPLKSLRLSFNVAYLDAHYVSFPVGVNAGGVLAIVDNSALRLPFSPKWAYGVDVQYTKSLAEVAAPLGDMTIDFNYSYKSTHTTNTNDVPAEASPAYGLLNAYLRLTDASSHYWVQAYVNNLTNKYYFLQGGFLAGLGNFYVDGPPRTYGVRVGASF